MPIYINDNKPFVCQNTQRAYKLCYNYMFIIVPIQNEK